MQGIRDSYPPLSALGNDKTQAYLRDLPDDYVAFLRHNNGGFADAFRYTFLTGVPFKTETVDNLSRDDCPVEFFGLSGGDASEGFPDDLMQVAREHADEGFLPRNVIAIARCVQNSLVCLSRRKEDFGSIYYWDWYWQYPWCEAFFRARLDEVRRQFEPADDILEDNTHPRHAELRDALNFATLTKLAPDFSSWLGGCEDRRQDD